MCPGAVFWCLETVQYNYCENSERRKGAEHFIWLVERNRRAQGLGIVRSVEGGGEMIWAACGAQEGGTGFRYRA